MNELLTFLSIILVPAIASVFVYLYKSKCSNVKLCYGCLDISRDVKGEEKLDTEMRTTNNIELTV